MLTDRPFVLPILQALDPAVAARFSVAARADYIVAIVQNRSRGDKSANMVDPLFVNGVGARGDFLDAFLLLLAQSPELFAKRSFDLELTGRLAVLSGKTGDLATTIKSLRQSEIPTAGAIADGLLSCGDPGLTALVNMP